MNYTQVPADSEIGLMTLMVIEHLKKSHQEASERFPEIAGAMPLVQMSVIASFLSTLPEDRRERLATGMEGMAKAVREGRAVVFSKPAGPAN